MSNGVILLANKRARFDYELIKTYTAGIQLEGREVKSLRNKNGSLKESYVKIIGGEAFLINAQISPYSFANNETYDPKRTRKLLLKKKELAQIAEASNRKKLTVIAVAIFLQGNTIKLDLAIARGKKEFEKRAKIKKRDQERAVRRGEFGSV